MSHLPGTVILETPLATSISRTGQAGDAARPLGQRAMDHLADLLPTVPARVPWTGIGAQTLETQLQYRRRHFTSVRTELPTPQLRLCWSTTLRWRVFCSTQDGAARPCNRAGPTLDLWPLLGGKERQRVLATTWHARLSVLRMHA